jgi:hypothetical protein
MYGRSYMFWHYIAILSVSIAFWDMLNVGAVDRILWMGVLCLVTWCVVRNNNRYKPIHNILSTAQLSISQRTLGMLPEDGNVTPKHVGGTIHN